MGIQHISGHPHPPDGEQGRKSLYCGPCRSVTFWDLHMSIYLTKSNGIELTRACFIQFSTPRAIGIKLTKTSIVPSCNARLFRRLVHSFRCIFARVLCPFRTIRLMFTASAALDRFPPPRRQIFFWITFVASPLCVRLSDTWAFIIAPDSMYFHAFKVSNSCSINISIKISPPHSCLSLSSFIFMQPCS